MALGQLIQAFQLDYDELESMDRGRNSSLDLRDNVNDMGRVKQNLEQKDYEVISSYETYALIPMMILLMARSNTQLRSSNQGRMQEDFRRANIVRFPYEPVALFVGKRV